MVTVVRGVVSDGIHWISVTALYRRRIRIVSIASLAAMLVLGTVMLMLAFDVPAPAFPMLPVVIAAVVLAAAVTAHVTLFVTMRRVFRLRLGTDGRDFFFDPGVGNPERYAFNSLATRDGRQLLAGKRLIPLYGPVGFVFDAEEVRSCILARMTPSSRVGIIALVGQALHQGNRELWFIAVVCVAAVAALALLFLFPWLLESVKSGFPLK